MWTWFWMSVGVGVLMAVVIVPGDLVRGYRQGGVASVLARMLGACLITVPITVALLWQFRGILAGWVSE